jgi:hypothetical protein
MVQIKCHEESFKMSYHLGKDNAMASQQRQRYGVQTSSYYCKTPQDRQKAQGEL